MLAFWLEMRNRKSTYLFMISMGGSVMLSTCRSAFLILLASATGSGALACNPEGLAKNFSSQRSVESQWGEVVIDDQCALLTADASNADALEALTAHFQRGHEGNAVAQGTIDGCSAEQIIQAACLSE